MVSKILATAVLFTRDSSVHSMVHVLILQGDFSLCHRPVKGQLEFRINFFSLQDLDKPFFFLQAFTVCFFFDYLAYILH